VNYAAFFISGGATSRALPNSASAASISALSASSLAISSSCRASSRSTNSRGVSGVDGMGVLRRPRGADTGGRGFEAGQLGRWRVVPMGSSTVNSELQHRRIDSARRLGQCIGKICHVHRSCGRLACKLAGGFIQMHGWARPSYATAGIWRRSTEYGCQLLSISHCTVDSSRRSTLQWRVPTLKAAGFRIRRSCACDRCDVIRNSQECMW
jgi:hypothetical protein